MVLRKRVLKVAVIAVIVFVAVAVVGFVALNLVYSKLPENMATIEKYMPQLKSVLRSETRFDGASASFDTSHLGSIYIEGRVRSKQDLRDLKALVESTRPPRPVFWHVSIDQAIEAAP